MARSADLSANLSADLGARSQASRLQVRGVGASIEERLAWTVRQALVPLFFADVTTAFSLLINCFSSIDAVFQFGLCGGA